MQNGRYTVVRRRDEPRGRNQPRFKNESVDDLSISSSLACCETTASLQFTIGFRGIAGTGFWGGRIDVPFGTVGTEKTEWDFKPVVTGSWGKSPIGLRGELYGNGVLKGKYSNKN